ncbi:MAG: hypothetical protein DRK00_06140 [Thermoprotei archaeon]|nr:MAG: hypothetical protein DRK00_06140 [Thermoprotei archaeon]
MDRCGEEPTCVPSAGYLLPAILHVPLDVERPKPVLFLHGFTGNKCEAGRLFVDMARAVCVEGYAALRFDFRGHGDAPLPFEEFRITYAIEDAASAANYLKRMGRIDASEIGLIGLSMGGGVAVKLAAEREDVTVLILLSPALDFTELASTVSPRSEGGYIYLGALRLKAENGVELSSFNVMGLADRVRAATLIIHSPDDKVVPISQAKRFYEKLRVEKKFVEVRGGHVFEDYHVRREVIEEVVAWLRDHL